jgi:excisionase family DNA binding protein
MEKQHEFVTVEDAALRIGVHEQTVRRWLRAGQMEGTLITRQTGYRIRKDEVERVLTEGLRPMGKLAA